MIVNNESLTLLSNMLGYSIDAYSSSNQPSFITILKSRQKKSQKNLIQVSRVDKNIYGCILAGYPLLVELIVSLNLFIIYYLMMKAFSCLSMIFFYIIMQCLFLPNGKIVGGIVKKYQICLRVILAIVSREMMTQESFQRSKRIDRIDRKEDTLQKTEGERIS